MQEILLKLEELINLSFWIQFVEKFKDYGPLAPILLALLESLIPALPLLVIISFNVGVYGPYLGFVYSWLGTTLGSIIMFYFYRKIVKNYLQNLIEKKEKLSQLQQWISSHQPITLFVLSALPFTPSSLINLGYGMSDFDEKTFVLTIFLSKSVMVMCMTLFGHSLVNIAEQPWFIVIMAVGLFGCYRISKFYSKKYLNHS